MCNYKALGIEKDMTYEYSTWNDSDLKKLIDSEYFNHPHITNRKEAKEFCNVRVIDCEHDNWWYANLIGFEFMCEVQYVDYGRGKIVKQFKGVKLTKNKIMYFRDFSPKDVSIV